MLRFLRTHHVFTAFMVPLVTVLVWLPSLLNPSEGIMYHYYSAGPLAEIIFLRLTDSPLVLIFSSFALTLTGAYLTDRMNAKFILLQERTQFPAFLFVLLAGSIPSFQSLHPAHLSLPFVIMAMERIISTYRIDKLSYQPFEAALLVSVASLFYLPAILFLLMIWAGLYLFRPGYWREWVFTIFGFLLPWFFYASFLYLTDLSISMQTHMLWEKMCQKNAFRIENTGKIWFIFLGILMILSSHNMVLRFQAKKIIARRSFTLLFWLFVFSLCGLILIPVMSMEFFYFAAMPLSLLFSHYFMNAGSRFLTESLFLFILIFVAVLILAQ